MKPILYFSLSLGIILLAFGGCNKDPFNKDNVNVTFIFYDASDSRFVGVHGDIFDSTNNNDDVRIPNVRLDFYANETDYVANKNITKTLYSDAKGRVKFNVAKTLKEMFFRATKDTLNSDLSGLFTNNEQILTKHNKDKFKFSNEEIKYGFTSFYRGLANVQQQYEGNTGYAYIQIALTLSITNLKCTVFKNGVKQTNKQIILTSEYDRNLGIFSTTNSDGVALFKFLFPIKYYIYLSDNYNSKYTFWYDQYNNSPIVNGEEKLIIKNLTTPVPSQTDKLTLTGNNEIIISF